MTLIYLGIGWLTGMAAGAALALKWTVWLSPGLFLLAAAGLQRHNRPVWRIHRALAFAFLGATRYRAGLPRFGPAARLTAVGPFRKQKSSAKRQSLSDSSQVLGSARDRSGQYSPQSCQATAL